MTCQLNIEQNGLAVITLNQPPVNAIGDDMLNELSRHLKELELRDDVGALLIQGTGKHFSAGADIKQIESWGSGDAATEKLVVYSARLQDTFLRIAQLPYPSIAAVHGTAAGAGLELALACDLRVVSEDASLGLPEVRFGWIASAGGTQRLTARVGRSAALRIMLTEEFISGAEAGSVDLADWVVPAVDLAQKARAIGSRIATHPRAAVRAVKSLVGNNSANGFANELYLTRTLEYEQTSQQLVSGFLTRKQ